jgi:hypothetical protein
MVQTIGTNAALSFWNENFRSLLKSNYLRDSLDFLTLTHRQFNRHACR